MCLLRAFIIHYRKYLRCCCIPYKWSSPLARAPSSHQVVDSPRYGCASWTVEWIHNDLCISKSISQTLHAWHITLGITEVVSSIHGVFGYGTSMAKNSSGGKHDVNHYSTLLPQSPVSEILVSTRSVVNRKPTNSHPPPPPEWFPFAHALPPVGTPASLAMVTSSAKV